MTTPFERGKAQGQWTHEQVKETGFSSAQDCLEHQEEVYQDEIANLPSLHQSNPEYAAQHAEFLEGLIAGERESLQALIKSEQVNTIAIILCSNGDPHNKYPTADPYWNDESPWNECVRGDGMSYGGVVGHVEREEGESDEAFYARAVSLEDSFL